MAATGQEAPSLTRPRMSVVREYFAASGNSRPVSITEPPFSPRFRPFSAPPYDASRVAGTGFSTDFGIRDALGAARSVNEASASRGAC